MAAKKRSRTGVDAAIRRARKQKPKPALTVLRPFIARSDEGWVMQQIDIALRGLEFAIIWLRKERFELEQMQREAGRKKLRKTLRKVKR